MMNLFLTALLAVLLCCVGLTRAHVRQTSDAIVVEAAEILGERKDRSMNTKSNEALPSEEKSCWTPDGKMGTCGTVRSCYPHFKLPDLSNLETWVLGTRGTCHYVERDGRNVYGVCCPKEQKQTTLGGNGQVIPTVPINPETGLPYPDFPWWQYFPYIPQYPTSPTAPTTAAPESSSPWWVPDPTTQRPTSTSPWWVPDVTSPWWIPEVTSPTSPPWWATQPTTTTTTTTAAPETAPIISQGVASTKAECGKGPKKIALFVDEQSRIVGGTPARKNSWPFQVALLNNGRQFCGASLLDSTHILTAAHCVAHMSSYDVAKLEAALGMHSLKPIDPEAKRIKIKRVTRHKGFNSRTLYNDIAILTLASPVTFGPTMSPVCLPSAGSTTTYEGKEAAVIGWGALKEGGSQPSVLQQVTVLVQSNTECKKNYGNDAPGGIVDHMICAAYPNKDSCSGDSGGPMIIQSGPDSPWVQAGIVSWGIGCGKAPYPGVYTRVTSFMNWITTNSQN